MKEVTSEGGNLVILVSYSTPVAYKVYVPATGGWIFARCEESYSVTTSKHINAWLEQIGPLDGVVAKVPQADIAALCPVSF